MGAVYRATDTKLNRDVAVKVLPESFAADPERLARFTREAQVLASLNHPNIGALYGVEEGALILELVEGATLHERLPIPADDALPLIHQLIDALEYAHEKGVVHRDLKPANIKITPQGTLKLLDFGLAKAIEPPRRMAGDPDQSPTVTLASSMPGHITGTARYMSPEHIRGARVDHRTDIWAFGAVLFEMLTGEPAFPGPTVTDSLAAVLKTDPDFAAVPVRYRKLVERCLQRDLKRRLGWIGDARLLLEDEPAATTTTPRWTLAAGLALAAAVVGFGISRLLPPRSGTAGLPPAKISRVTSDIASVLPAISPDGKLVAYLARRAGRATLDLWVQQVGGGAAIPLTQGSLPVRIFASPTFSADSSRVLYYSDVGSPGIYEIPVLGGEPRLAIPGAGIYRVCPSPDGKWLAYVLDGKLMLRPASGGDPRQIAQGHQLLQLFLAWSPDSSRILAAPQNTERTPVELLLVPADGSQPKKIDGNLIENLTRRGFTDLNIMRLLAWLPSDDLVFTARYGDARNIWRIPLAHLGDAQPSAVTVAPWNNGSADIRGTHLVFANERLANQVWSLPADLNRGVATGELTRVTGELAEAQFPSVQPDGSALAYIARRSGVQSVSLLDLQTGRDRTLVVPERNAAYTTFSADGKQIAFGNGGDGWPAFAIPSAGGDIKRLGDAGGRIRGWSHDGRYLLIWRVPAGKNTIGVLDLTTGRAAETLRSDSANLGMPQFSPDSRWVAFASDAPGASIWIAPFRGNDAVPESEWSRVAEGALNPFWSPDGRSLNYARLQDANLYAARLYRLPIDPATGRPSGPETEFYKLDGFSYAMPLLNTISATRDRVYLLLTGGMSDIWTMELPMEPRP